MMQRSSLETKWVYVVVQDDQCFSKSNLEHAPLALGNRESGENLAVRACILSYTTFFQPPNYCLLADVVRVV